MESFWSKSPKWQFFDENFGSKMTKKVDFHQIDPKFVGKCYFWRWSRISDLFSPNRTVSEVIDEILQKVPENRIVSTFEHWANGPGLRGHPNFIEFLTWQEAKELKFITQIDIRNVSLTQKKVRYSKIDIFQSLTQQRAPVGTHMVRKLRTSSFNIYWHLRHGTSRSSDIAPLVGKRPIFGWNEP